MHNLCKESWIKTLYKCAIYHLCVLHLITELTEMNSFVKTELHLTLGCEKEDEQQGPPALLCYVLQALAIQGDLQHKFKLFSKALTQLYQSN